MKQPLKELAELSEIQDDVQEIISRVKDLNTRAHKAVDPYIEDGTWKTIAIATGIGALAAYLFMQNQED